MATVTSAVGGWPSLTVYVPEPPSSIFSLRGRKRHVGRFCYRYLGIAYNRLGYHNPSQHDPGDLVFARHIRGGDLIRDGAHHFQTR